MSDGLTHFDEAGNAVMVDVSDKADTERVAVAKGSVLMAAETLHRIQERGFKKGDVLTVAQTAKPASKWKPSSPFTICARRWIRE